MLSVMLLLVGSLALHPARVRLQHAPTARRYQRPRPLLQPAARMPRVPSAPSMVTPSELLEIFCEKFEQGGWHQALHDDEEVRSMLRHARTHSVGQYQSCMF